MIFGLTSRSSLLFLITLTLSFHAIAGGPTRQQNPLSKKPTALRCDSLTEPLGIDTPEPMLSWRLNDPVWGAKQTAYEILVASKASILASGKGDIWDSGRVTSEISAGVPYGGPRLEPERRYFWRVKVWNQNATLYSASDTSWFETGLMSKEGHDAWKGRWIGYESPELHSIRESEAIWITNASAGSSLEGADTHHNFRHEFTFRKPVERAVLYVAGRDTPAAWVNGQPVLSADPLTPWKQMPWGTYKKKDITGLLRDGRNSLAVDVTHYWVARRPVADTKTPMSACLYVLFKDGSTELVTSSAKGWKGSLNANAGWTAADFNDSSWKNAERYGNEGSDFNNDDLTAPWPTGPVTMLRRTFSETKPIVSARLYATALGAYKFHLNGQEVGDQIMAPGWMDFREHVPYQVYDVTKQLHAGENAIGAYLAAGWYATPLRWLRQGNNYGNTQPALRAQLRIEHTDGSVEWIATDDSWKADSSPIVFAEIYDGETFDARLIQHGWDAARFADATWKPASIVPAKTPKIVSQYFQPIRYEKVMAAKTIASPSPGIYVYDFGQNLSGVPKIRVQGRRGDDVKLRFAEVLNPDGSMYVENLRTAKATDHFILAGSKGSEEYQPQFTFHGFRYVEISGLHAKPSLDAVKVAVLHTDAPFTSEFETGDPMVNKLWSNVVWGQRSNFVGVPTDCPQRDERLGWTADAQVFWRTASYNMDLTTFSQKYAADIHGTQVGTAMYGIYAPGLATPNPGFGAGWSDAGVIVPWTGWIQSGNRKIVDENWEGMKAYLNAIDKQNPDHLWRQGFGTPFGDWLTPTITTPEDLIATAYFAYDVTLMRQMAEATGRDAEARRYATLFENIKASFQKAYVKGDGFVGTIDQYPSIPPPTVTSKDAVVDTSKQVVETQTGYVLALYMKLLPGEMRSAAAAKLVEKIEANHWTLGTGFLGTPYLLEVLSDTGHSDLAYRLLLNREYPSWGYLIDHGATTTWERWNGDTMRNDPSMNSYNHYAYGAVAEWMYRYAAGVDTMPNDAGFHTIYLHANFDDRLGHIKFAYQTPYGIVRSAWTATGKSIAWTVTIPPNTTARLPLNDSNATSFTVDGTPIDQSKKIKSLGEQTYELPAGTYSLKATMTHESKVALAGGAQ